MATTENASEFRARLKLLEPDGPVCLIVKAKMGVAADLDRFQPAGFPEVGHVIYDAPRPAGCSEKVCIVDSPASMANHLEQVCMADEEHLHPDLAGLPHVKCVTDRNRSVSRGDLTPARDDPRDRVVTTTLTEGHRIASDYFLDGLVNLRWVEETTVKVKARKQGEKEQDKVIPAHWEGDRFREVLRQRFMLEAVNPGERYFVYPECWWHIYKTLFELDPNSLVHGVLFAKEQIKISRVLTAHLEAFGAARVGRSGVKFDRLGKTNSGQPIFAVDEETAREIRATFILDLALLRSYGRDGGEGSAGVGLGRGQKELLLALALWKIKNLLGQTFSYRSGCKLRVREVAIMTDESDEPVATGLPDPGVKEAISTAGFAGERITCVYYPFDQLFKTGKADSAPTASDQDAGDEGGEDESEG